jgi:predicted amidohydrolase YtcJ
MAARLTAYIVACIVGVTLIAGLIVGAQREDDGPVDLIIVNGRVHTGTGQRAEAVAVQGNKVLKVGTNRDVQRLRRAQTTVIDAKGGTVLPGFNDAHTHLVSGGLGLQELSLADATTIDAVKDAVRAWADAHPSHDWIHGRGWYYAAFPGGLPTRQLLDTLVPDRPAYLVAYDGHTGWANTRALALAGITRRTKSPAGGLIVKDARTGEPTGVLKESAMRLADVARPQATRADRLAAIRAAMSEAHRMGVTSVQSAGGQPDELDLYDELRRRGELTVRVYQALSADASLDDAAIQRLEQAFKHFADDPLLKSGAIKLVADGVVETRTAAMLAPYATRPVSSGEPLLPPAALTRIVALLDKQGWQVLTHAIGDAAVRATLDAYEQAARANPAPPRGRRHRIEHIETVDEADVPRFGTLGVIASMQPFHAAPPTPADPWAIQLGPERAARGWLIGSLARAGAHLAFGSDWPVVSLDPRFGLYTAVTRKTAGGEPEGGWNPAERISLADAVDAYTRGAAFAAFDEQRKGTLARDMLADVVVMSADIFTLPPDELLQAEVAVTIADGRVVYRRDAPSTTR